MVAYPRSRDNIEVAWSALNDGPIAMPNEMAYPWKLPSVAGDFVMASRKRKVAPGGGMLSAFVSATISPARPPAITSSSCW